MVTYSCERSEKNTSVSAPSPGQADHVLDLVGRPPRRPARRGRRERRSRASTRVTPSISTSIGQRRAAGQGRAGRLHDAPPVGVAAVQSGLDQRRVGHRAGHRLDAPRGGRRARPRAPPAGPPRRRRRSAAPAGAAARPAPRRSAARRRSRAPRATPLAPLAIRITVSLVDSCPSTEMRSKERFTHTPSSSSAVSALERGVGLHEAQHRGEARRDHARALALGAEAHAPRPTGAPTASRACRARRWS